MTICGNRYIKRSQHVILTHLIIQFLRTVCVLAVQVVTAIQQRARKLRTKIDDECFISANPPKHTHRDTDINTHKYTAEYSAQMQHKSYI